MKMLSGKCERTPFEMQWSMFCKRQVKWNNSSKDRFFRVEARSELNSMFAKTAAMNKLEG